jgi:hypothetical protein
MFEKQVLSLLVILRCMFVLVLLLILRFTVRSKFSAW